jgi:hypothetical protein
MKSLVLAVVIAVLAQSAAYAQACPRGTTYQCPRESFFCGCYSN